MSEARSELESLRRQADDPTEEQIIAEIEVTRTEMSGTIDELGQRLNPQVLVDQAREQIREATVGRVERIVQDAGDTAQQTGNTIIGTIRENPVPATLAAIGIGWLAMRLRDNAGRFQAQGNGHRRHAYRGEAGGGYGTDAGRYGVRGSYGLGDSYSDRGGEAGGGMAERGQQIGEDISRRGQELGEQAQQAARDVSEQAQATLQDVQWQAQGQLDNVQRQFDRTLDQNPLALGALAVGVGAAVALAIPETEQERQLMGEQRDKLLSEVEG
ncbi:MAG TPA: DUF3618 domain-containing protein, partial [Candidatus Limnocylindria bacterium]|nr:DUF3618 domain-containing protein [Candidatus Limnocylindria bacterium]